MQKAIMQESNLLSVQNRINENTIACEDTTLSMLYPHKRRKLKHKRF